MRQVRGVTILSLAALAMTTACSARTSSNAARLTQTMDALKNIQHKGNHRVYASPYYGHHCSAKGQKNVGTAGVVVGYYGQVNPNATGLYWSVNYPIQTNLDSILKSKKKNIACDILKENNSKAVLAVGYKILENDKASLRVSVEGVLANNKTTEVKRYNTGVVTKDTAKRSPWGLGAAVEGSVNLNQNLKVLGRVSYHHMFSCDEKRTRCLIAGQNLASPKMPESPVKCNPGDEVEGTVALAYNSGDFGATLGYNVLWAGGDVYGTKKAGQTKCKSQLTHTALAGVTYTPKVNGLPIELGVHGGYHFGDDKGYTVGASVGFSF